MVYLNVDENGLCYIWGYLQLLSKAYLVAKMVKNMPAIQETQVQSLSQEDLLEKGMATHSSILTSRIPWTEQQLSYSPWGRKESDMIEWFHFLLLIPQYKMFLY